MFETLLQPVHPNLDLHHAVSCGNFDPVKQLLVEGANPCAGDTEVCTAAAAAAVWTM